MTLATIRRPLAALLVASLAGVGLLGCTAGNGGDSSVNTVTVWDYYGQTTPLKEAIARFTKANPDVKVDYQAFDYETMQEKLSVAVSAGTGPDLATVDMTWIPQLASKGVLADLESLSGGKLNGSPISDQYSTGALAAMRYKDQMVAALYDFDAYALYYRKDILEAKGLQVPTTWDELRASAGRMAEDTNGDGKPDKYGLQVLPDTFHYVQLLLQNGGEVLDSQNQVAFDSPAGVEALAFNKSLLTSGGVYWGASEGDSSGLPGIKDERIGMFLNGPYMMGVLKDGAPEQAGKWAVAPAPFSKRPGSYLGGTGLVVPVNATHSAAAWKLAQFLLQPEQQLLVYSTAGAAPATTAALKLPELQAPDKYFGGEAPFPIFQDAMATATPFPYVAAWPDIDTALTDATTSALIGKATPEAALSVAANTAGKALGG